MGSLGAEASKLSNQARFVLEKIEGKISIGKNAKIQLLTQQCVVEYVSFLTVSFFVLANREQI